jgi:hypothetical protein
MWEPRRLTTLWASTACYRDSVTSFLPFYYDNELQGKRMDIILAKVVNMLGPRKEKLND